jgi:hypothetical protein
LKWCINKIIIWETHTHIVMTLVLSFQLKQKHGKWSGLKKCSKIQTQSHKCETLQPKKRVSTLPHFESCNFINDSNIWNKVWHLDHASRCFHCGVANFHLTSNPPLDHSSDDRVKRVIFLYNSNTCALLVETKMF